WLYSAYSVCGYIQRFVCVVIFSVLCVCGSFQRFVRVCVWLFSAFFLTIQSPHDRQTCGQSLRQWMVGRKTTVSTSTYQGEIDASKQNMTDKKRVGRKTTVSALKYHSKTDAPKPSIAEQKRVGSKPAISASTYHSEIDALKSNITDQKKVFDNPVSVSTYHSEIDAPKPKPKQAGSQEAPANATVGLLTKHPAGRILILKVLLAVGGWKIGSKPFLPVIKSEEVWKKWVVNVIDYLRKYNFDGFDMDWEFPAWRGSGPEDRHKFTLFMKDLYHGFAEEARASGKERLLLTLATASSAFYAEKSYEQSEIHKYIDYMLLMTYNYHGSGWEKQTGHHSPLLPHPLDPEGEQSELYALWSVKYWLNFGVPKEKIILGLATYGLGWKLVDGSQTGVRAPADGGNTKGKYTEESGILSHYEICEKVINEGWEVKWIDEQKVPYAYGGGEWVGFDSPDSFYLKAATIIREGLGGAFVWSVEMDDFNGHCGGPKYPLLRTIYEVFTQSSHVARLLSQSELKSAPASGRQNIQKAESPKQSSSAAAKTDIVDCESLGLGIHADPSSCQHFILCMPVNQHHLGSTRMVCPEGTLYDAQLKICNHKYNVVCEH
ncbi:unnamed protein product, partial [Candidula unifasciata]